MQSDFWLDRWREGRIGFHQDRVTPMLERHWDAIGLAPAARVFVPLAGKSLDLLWLASRGHRVLGVELSGIAVEQFFSENRLSPTRHDSRYGVHYVAGEIELIHGDAFALDEALLETCEGVYDRAALIALPRHMRCRYAAELYGRLPAGCRGLLVTLAYPQGQKAGPPFSVQEDEVRSLYDAQWRIDVLERRDILDSQPGFVAEGVTSLETVAYRLQRR
jgi:thiopurine S-methyltransferase